MIDTKKMKEDLSIMTNAVNGVITAEDIEEKKAWIIIYNARINAVNAQIDEVERELNATCENPDMVVEPEENAPVEFSAPAENVVPADAEKFVLDE